MDDYIFSGFLEGLKKDQSKTRGITIEPNHFEEFQISVTGDGKLDLNYMADLYKWLGETLKIRAHQLEFIIRYHPDSPKYWLRDIEKITNEEESLYSVSLDLERFMESEYRAKQRDRIKALGSFIPDNYELARKVFKEFRKDHKNKKFNIINDNHWRECANWESKDLTAIKALAKFVSEKYVEPYLQDVLKENNIEEVLFSDKKVDFKYNK